MEPNNSKLIKAFSVCKQSFVAVGTFSLLANVLMLVPAFFMLNVYDKAVAYSSLPTLWVLSGITLFLFLMLASIEAIRSRVLIAVGSRIDRFLGTDLYDFTLANAVRVGGDRASVQPLADLSGLRQFLAGPGVFAFFDAPWLPIYLAIMFLFHPLLGWLGVASACAFVMIAVLNERQTAPKLTLANQHARSTLQETQRNLRNAEVAVAMGMGPALQAKWRSSQDETLSYQEDASHIASNFNAVTKTLRTATQSAAIAAGAYLVIKQEISPGMLIAGSILIGRALSPIEQLVGTWKGFIEAREQYLRIGKALSVSPPASDRMSLPPITGSIMCRSAVVVPPGEKKPAIANVSLDVPAGHTCLIIGPSGAGKSTFVKAALGLWPTSNGEIRIDGTLAANFCRTEIGTQVGFLPQGIELFDGTIAENIARFSTIDSDSVITAAKDAGIHELVLSFPDGYDTRLGAGRFTLSPGQAQRIALARAVYQRPSLVFMDEPNSNLDDAGERALSAAIQTLKDEGSTVLIVSHRTAILPLADLILVLSNGRVADFGAAQDVLSRLQSGGNHHSTASTTSKPTSPAGMVTVPVKP